MKHEIVLQEVASGETVATFSQDQGNIGCVAFARHGRTLAAGSEEGGLTVWDVTGLMQAGALPAVKMSKGQLLAQVDLLRGGDAAKAHKAIWTLAAAGPEALPLVEPILPRPGVAAKIKQSIAVLSDPVFAVRDKAMKQLTEFADEAEPSLAQTLANPPDEETRRRVEILLRKLEQTTVAKRSVQVRRAVAVLEYAGTKEARSLLVRVAQDAPQDPLTQHVLDVLARWKTKDN